MRAFSVIVLALAAAALAASPAMAQRFGGGGGVGQLAMNRVQEELKLTDEQKEKIAEAIKKVREDNKEEFEKLRDPDLKPEQRAEILKKLNEANNKALAGILKAEQQKRLKQIVTQQQGVAAFLDAEVQKTLKLTDEQKKKATKLDEDLQKEVRELFAGGFDPENVKKMQALRKDALDKALADLNADQKKAYKEMIGEPFEVQFEFRKPMP